MRRARQRLGATGSVVLLGFAVASCGEEPAVTPSAVAVDDAGTGTDAPPAATDAPDAGATELAEDADQATAAPDAPAAYTTPDWGNPVTTPGDLLVTAEVGSFEVDIYQVDVLPADRDSSSVDPSTDEPIVAEGEEIVFVNYVVRNVTSEPVNMTYARVGFVAAYDDWPYLGGMSAINSTDQFEQLGLNSNASGAGLQDVDYFTIGPGEWVAQAENYPYQPGSEIEFTVRYLATDDEGEPLADGRYETVTTTTIE